MQTNTIKEAKMGFRYRKSVNIGPLRLNSSKSGLGWSIGVPGARYTKMANGRTRRTASIPGTGISFVEESKKPVQKPEMDDSEKFAHVLWEILKVIGLIAFVFLFFMLDFAAKGGKK